MAMYDTTETVELAGHTYELKVRRRVRKMVNPNNEWQEGPDRIVAHRCIGRWGWGTGPIGGEWLETKLEEAVNAKFIN